jgi:hypothetical protein
MSYCPQAVTLIGRIAGVTHAHQAESWFRICAVEVVRHRGVNRGANVARPASGLKGLRSGTGEQGSCRESAAVAFCLQLLLLDVVANRT